MATPINTNQTYALDGSTREFTIPFEYLARKFVVVTLVGATRLTLAPTEYRFTSASTIVTVDTWGASNGYDFIELRRVTSATERIVSFNDGSILRATDLNISQTQAIHIAEEGRDVSSQAMLNTSLSWDALNLRIKNLANPLLNQDAATKFYVDSTQATGLSRAIRVATGETLSQLPSASLRANKVLGFDAQGNPTVMAPQSGSGTELAMILKDPDQGTSAIAYRNVLSNGFNRTLKEKLGDIVSAKDAGATGDGVTDDSLAVQGLIDALSAQGGGCIYFPRGIYRLNVVLKKYVSLVGASWGAVRGLGVSGSTINRWITTFKAAGPGFVVDTVETSGGSIGINGIDFIGLGASVPGGGVKIRYGNGNGIFRSMMFSGFADEALISEALVGRFSDLMCTNCLLRRVRTERAGAFTIKGADNYIDNVEGNTGITGIVSSDLFLCGIYIGGANNYALNLMGELSEIGIFVEVIGATHKISNSRADLNFGHGYVGPAMFSNCHAHNNSNGQPGVYSGFVSGQGASGAQYTGCRATGAHKYGVDVSGSDFTDLAQRPHLSNFVSSGHVTAEINYPVTNGIVVGLTGAHLRNITAAGVISVAGGINSIRFSHVADTVITGFTGEHIGQMVTVVATATATIFARSATFIVHGVDGAGQKRLQVGRAYTFIKGQTAWVETTDNCVIPVVATRPNTFAVPGMMVFDSVINKPIWRNAANTGWVDATGATV